MRRITGIVLCAYLCTAFTGSDGFDMTPYCTPKEPCYPSTKQLRTLDESLDGRVIFKNRKEFTEQSKMYNIHEQRSPNVVVMVKSEEDIRAALLFARNYNLRVAIRSSGHSYVGRSTADDAFIINMSEMDGFKIKLKDKRHRDGVLITQTGVTWETLHVALDNVDRIAVGGACLTVTPGGYTLGGGHGAISPSYGYAVDNLLEVRLVLVDGSFATCTERKTVIEHVNGRKEVINDGDLFWALKGGGGGTYGAVVHLVFKIHKAPESVVVFSAIMPLEADVFPSGDLKKEAFESFFSVFPAVAAEWGGYWISDNLPSDIVQLAPYPYRGVLMMSLLKLAPWDGSEPTLFRDILAFTAANNMIGELVNMTSFLEYGLSVGANIAKEEDVHMFSTLLLPESAGLPFSTWFNQSLFDPSHQAYMQCTAIVLGGATMTLQTDSPLHPGYRRAVSALMCKVYLQDPYDDILIQLGDMLGQSLKTLGDGEYFNEPTKNNANWKEDSWGMENYQRLLGIKYRYDPTNFLTCHHCVASDVTPNDGPLFPVDAGYDGQ